MKLSAALCLLWLLPVAGHAADLPLTIDLTDFEPVQVLEVIDGDTTKFNVFDGSRILTKECWSKRDKRAALLGRTHGGDTGETSEAQAKCKGEIAKGNKAKQFVKDRIRPGDTVLVKHIPGEKYQCRIDVVVLYGPDNTNIMDELIAEGLAYPYFGKTKKSWCGK